MRVGASELADGGWFVRALADRATDIDELLLGLSAQWWRFRADLGNLPKLAYGSLVSADVSALG